MTTEELDALWCRLVSEARWMAGMRGHDRGRFFRVLEVNSSTMLVWFEHPLPGTRAQQVKRFYLDGCPPIRADWTDPATLGCLLAMVREAWRAVDACVYYRETGWIVGSYLDDSETDSFDTEAEALLRALEAAP